MEYMLPNYFIKGQKPECINVSMEISSEYPGTKEDWPSEITFSLAEKEIGRWISPGDFGASAGNLNPPWWEANLNQYGLLKMLSIGRDGTFIDGQKISDIVIDDIDLSVEKIKLRIAVKEDARYKGGVTLFGRGFGNYDQNILVDMYYTDEQI